MTGVPRTYQVYPYLDEGCTLMSGTVRARGGGPTNALRRMFPGKRPERIYYLGNIPCQPEEVIVTYGPLESQGNRKVMYWGMIDEEVGQ